MNKKRMMNIVLGIFLVLTGLMALMPGLGVLGIISSILAIAAGVLILVSSSNISKDIGWTLAALYLITRGIVDLTGISFKGIGTVMGVLALAAGILLLLRAKNIFQKFGFLLFFVWLILVGLANFIGFGEFSVIIPIVAIASGVLVILER